MTREMSLPAGPSGKIKAKSKMNSSLGMPDGGEVGILPKRHLLVDFDIDFFVFHEPSLPGKAFSL